jgi:hypothetical protein
MQRSPVRRGRSRSPNHRPSGRAFPAGLLLLLLGVAGSGFAQDDINDMFGNPDAGIIEESQETMDAAQATVEKGPPLFFGSLTLEGGFSFGVKDWTQPLDDPANFDFSPLYAVESYLKLDVRPWSQLRLFGSFGVNSPYVDPDEPDRTVVDFSPVFVDELFVDYTLAERLFFRVGKQDMTWGQGRLYNPGDFVSEAIDGISIKGFIPLGTNGLTLAAIGEGVLGPSPPDYSSVYDLIAGAALFETSLSSLTLGLSGYYRTTPGLRTGAYLRMPVAGIDVALEGVANWGPYVDGFDSAQVLASLFWDGGRDRWQVILEYLFDSSVPDWRGHSLGLGAVVRDWLPNGWKPGVRWLHSFADNSGQVVVGIEGPVAPYLRLVVALPFRYGVANPYYEGVVTDELPNDETLERVQETGLLEKLGGSMVVLLKLSLDF